MRFENRVAIVTGGGRALGRQIALQLARDGARVLLASPDKEELEAVTAEIHELRREAAWLLTDVSVEDQVAHMAEHAKHKFGQVDILVNNAGIIGPTAPATDVSRTDWDEVLAVNLTGAYLCAKAVIPDMISRRSGRIINISSMAGKIGYALRSPYAVSKWGLIGLTLTLAKELGEHNIQVNAVCPGPIEGGRMNQVFERRAEETGTSIEQVKQEYLQSTAMGRMVQASDVAAMVAYLASDDANNITGQAIDVSAGWGL